VPNYKEMSPYSRSLWRVIVFAGLTLAIAQPAFAVLASFPAEVITLDGRNNVTGKVRNVQVDIGDNSKNPVKIDKHPLVVSFQYYNGSYTQGGTQHLIFTFFDENGSPLNNVLPPLAVGLPRYKCWYGYFHPIIAQGPFNDRGQYVRIKSIGLTVDRLTGGPQPHC
jgi:hypothetical protein